VNIFNYLISLVPDWLTLRLDSGSDKDKGKKKQGVDMQPVGTILHEN